MNRSRLVPVLGSPREQDRCASLEARLLVRGPAADMCALESVVCLTWPFVQAVHVRRPTSVGSRQHQKYGRAQTRNNPLAASASLGSSTTSSGPTSDPATSLARRGDSLTSSHSSLVLDGVVPRAVHRQRGDQERTSLRDCYSASGEPGDVRARHSMDCGSSAQSNPGGRAPTAGPAASQGRGHPSPSQVAATAGPQSAGRRGRTLERDLPGPCKEPHEAVTAGASLPLRAQRDMWSRAHAAGVWHGKALATMSQLSREWDSMQVVRPSGAPQQSPSSLGPPDAISLALDNLTSSFMPQRTPQSDPSAVGRSSMASESVMKAAAARADAGAPGRKQKQAACVGAIDALSSQRATPVSSADCNTGEGNEGAGLSARRALDAAQPEASSPGAPFDPQARMPSGTLASAAPRALNSLSVAHIVSPSFHHQLLITNRAMQSRCARKYRRTCYIMRTAQ